MVKTAVLAWECGAGRGHAVRLAALGRSLRRNGWRVIYALQSLALSETLIGAGDRVVQAPIWPYFLKRNHTSRTRQTLSFTDILQDIGLDDFKLVSAMTAAWEDILLGADLLVADHAPGALFAARGRMPAIAVGTGFSVPCGVEGQFPPLGKNEPTGEGEAKILQSLNTARNGCLSRLADLYDEANPMPEGLSILDPYRHWRAYPLVAPRSKGLISMARDNPPSVFCYLHELTQHDDVVVSGLMQMGSAARLYIPGLQLDRAAFLEQAGVKIETKPVPIEIALSECHTVLHQGGYGLTCQALLAGRPQVFLPTDLEKQLNADALVECGTSLSLQPRRTTSDALASAVERTFADASFSQSATELALKMSLQDSSGHDDEIALRAQNIC